MRRHWPALLSCAVIATGAASALAQGPVPLDSAELDRVTPRSVYQASAFQLRITLDRATVSEPDDARNALLMEDLEADAAAQEMDVEALATADDPEESTPAQEGLRALAGSSGAAAWQDDPVQSAASPPVPVTTTSLATASATVGGDGQWAPTTRNTGIDGALSTERAPAMVSRSRSLSVAPRTAIGSPRLTAGSRPVAASRASPLGRQVLAARSEAASRPSTAGATRVATVSSARAMLAGTRAQVRQSLSALRSQTFGVHR